MSAQTRARLALVAAVPSLTLGVLGYHRRWVSEDAFIDFRVVQHLLAGHGPVYNLDERVEAYTNPLWVALLALWRGLGGPLEVGALGLGLGLAVLGLLAAEWGAARLSQDPPGKGRGPSRPPPVHLRAATGGHEPGLPLPLGAAVLAACPAAWDFATSGLETGLAFGWLGTTFWTLACLRAAGPGRETATAALIGLGPLIRPDLAVFSAAFLVALVVRTGVEGAWRGRTVGRLCLAAGLVPGAYQLFRMGYFAAVVPNTALAKEVTAAHWAQGWRYASDLVATYWLWVPLLILGAWWGVELRRAVTERDWATGTLGVAPVLAGLAHAAYIVRTGGDFMHGRLLLASLFGVLLPVATVRVPGRSPAAWVGVALVGTWGIGCALGLRLDYAGEIGPAGIADERGYYVRVTGRAHPVTGGDYIGTRFARDGLAFRRRADTVHRAPESVIEASPTPPRARVLLLDAGDGAPLHRSVDPRIALVGAVWNIGINGYVAGLDVHVVDRHGLADPFAGRLRLEARGRPGHEKALPLAWVVARFGDPAGGPATPEVLAARAALGCGDLAALGRAVEEPLTLARFVTNTRLAWRLHRLRIPADPTAARGRFCPGA